MMPAATAPVAPAVNLAGRDRAFYTGIAIFMAVTVFVGFAPTFYLRSLFGAPVSVTGMITMSPLAQLHGAVFTAWVALFIIQTSLIKARKVAQHRTLGVAGVVLAIAMVAVGLPTAFAAAARGSAPPGLDSITFLVVPVFDLVLFTGFIAAAVWRRKEKEAHKRLMLLAYVAIIPAAFGRLPGVIQLGPPGLFGLAFLPAVAGAIYDRWSRGRVTPIYWWGIAFLYLSVPVRLLVASTGAWKSFAEFVTR